MCAMGLIATIGTIAVLPRAFTLMCLTQQSKQKLGLASPAETELMLLKKVGLLLK